MGDIKASPRNRLLGLLADATQGVNEFASKPFGYNNPPGAMLAGLFGLPGLSNTMNELSYGGALGTGSGMTWKPKADTVDAAMTLLPLGATAGKAAIDGGVALARKAAPVIERAVPRVMERGGLSSQLLRDLSQNTVSPATVWHGSPHKFDKFDASKIGTGEGAQAYGHGLYLAEAKDVGQSYANELGNLEILHNGKSVGVFDKDPSANAAHQIRATGGDLDKAIRRAQNLYTGSWRDNVVSEIKRLGKGDVTERLDGNLYKVDLPDDAIAKMLDWDKPLSQQHPDVQAVLLKHPDVLDQIQKAEAQRLLLNERSPMRLEKIPSASVPYDASRMAGKDALTAIQQRSALGKTGGVEEQLRQAGIPGIRYLDGGSRGTGAGTSNFVVFPGNEGLLTILERNGQPMGLLGR